VKGTANVIRYFVPDMVRRKSGVIVNFSSGWGRSTDAEVAPYCASKWAIEGLTQALSQELPSGMAAVPVFLVFARRTERPPARLLWLLLLPVAVASAESLANVGPALFAAPTALTTLLFPYASDLAVVTVIVAACWLATDVRPLAGLVLAFTVTRVMYGFVYLSSTGTAATAVISGWIAALVILAGALAWLLRRRTRACASTTS